MGISKSCFQLLSWDPKETNPRMFHVLLLKMMVYYKQFMEHHVMSIIQLIVKLDTLENMSEESCIGTEFLEAEWKISHKTNCIWMHVAIKWLWDINDKGWEYRSAVSNLCHLCCMCVRSSASHIHTCTHKHTQSQLGPTRFFDVCFGKLLPYLPSPCPVPQMPLWSWLLLFDFLCHSWLCSGVTSDNVWGTTCATRDQTGVCAGKVVS